MGESNLRAANRLAFITGVGLIVVGAVGALASLVAMYQSQEQLSGGAFTVTRGPTAISSGPSLADRVSASLLFGGGSFLTAAFVVGIGVALCVAAAHLSARPVAAALEPQPQPPVIDVPLEVEEQVWGSVGTRPDENPLRP